MAERHAQRHGLKLQAEKAVTRAMEDAEYLGGKQGVTPIPMCKHCKTPLIPGEALIPTVVVFEDFPGEGASEGSTCGFGPGKLGPCLKCPECGYSVTEGAS